MDESIKPTKPNKNYHYSGEYKRSIEFWQRSEKDTLLAFWASTIFLITSYFFGGGKDIMVSSFFCIVSAGVILIIQIKIDTLTKDLNYVLAQKELFKKTPISNILKNKLEVLGSKATKLKNK
jgi:hypothetical protein